MSPKTFLALAVAALIALAAAGLATWSQQGGDDGLAQGPLYPDLLDRAAGVAGVRVTGPQGTVTVTKGADGWRLEERGGYPARADRVRSVVLGLASLQKFEAKTDKPEHYAALGLQDPSAEDARSKKLTLLDGDGGTIAAVIVGKQKYDLGGGERGVFLRKAGEKRSWLAKGRLDVFDQPKDWLQREVIHIDPERIERANLVHPDGHVLTATKAAGSDGFLGIDGVDLAKPHSLEGVGTVLSHLQLIDVRPADDISFNEDYVFLGEFTTTDGLTVHSRFMNLAGDNWIKLTAEAADDAPAEVKAKAETLAARLQPWVYKIPAFKATHLMKRVEDVRKKADETAEKAVGPVME